MKKLTIKTRVTLWYTVLLVFLMFLILGSMLTVSKLVVKESIYERLTSFVEENMEEIECDDGEVEIDDDFKGRENGTVCLIYDAQGRLIAGKVPSDMTLDEDFVDGRVKKFPARGRIYYQYDRRMELDPGHFVWLRGLVYDKQTDSVISATVKTVFLLLPFFSVAAAAGGYWIIKRSFRPIGDMIRMADEISAGEDLSKRICIESGNDEVHRLADTFNSMIERLETAFDIEKQFTSNVSHELRTPLTVIMSQCEFALENGNLREEEREAFEVIIRQTQKMSRMISQFLMFTRLEQGLEKMACKDTDLSGLIEQLCREREAFETEPMLRIDIEPGIRACVNQEMIGRLVSNLLDNAYKYGKEGEYILVSLKKREESIQLSVRDCGIGIEKEDLDKIWDRFYRTGQAGRVHRYTGTGLGLFIAREIAFLHGGVMKVESTPGKGSIFTCILPSE